MIAFAYAQSGQKMAALYQALADGLVANLREVCPQEKIAMLTDDSTPVVKGVHHVFRMDRTVPLMTWRLKAHQMAHSLSDEILFVEPDVRLVDDVMPVFNESFDIAITTREVETVLDNERRNSPYTLGMTFSRSADFWREAKLFCQKLPAEEQNWFGDLLAIASVIDGGNFNVKKLDGAVYNHVVNDPGEPIIAKALHYKGKRKAFLFPLVVEEAA